MSIPIVFGWGKGAKQLGEGFVHACGNCHNVRRFGVVETSRKVSLYFVPVAKWSREYFYVCPICSSGFKIPDRQLAQRILAGALGDPRSMPDDLAREIAQANGIAIAPPEQGSDHIEEERTAAEMCALRDDYLRGDQTRLCRLTAALAHFHDFAPAVPKDLAHFAVSWLLASLADSGCCREVESSFWLTVDAMYAWTPDAARQYSEDDRQRLFTDSVRKREHLSPAVAEGMVSAGRSLDDLEKDDFRRRPAEILCTLRRHFIEHARAADLRELVGACVAACKAIETSGLGCAPAPDVVRWLTTVVSVAAKISTSVEELLSAGTLVRKGDKIVRPGA